MGNKSKTSPNVAYLVIRDGKKWSDVFRLMPGRTITIGRSPTNQIVVKEDQASRQHAEVFMSEGKWTVRDLNSRNGTAIGTERLLNDHPLKVGDIIWIAGTQMAFVTDLSSAYSKKIFSKVELNAETITGLVVEDDKKPKQSEISLSEPTNITHRRQRTRYLQDDDPGTSEDLFEAAPPDPISSTKDATLLCRLAFDLANETTPRAIARMALDCLDERTMHTAGAVLLIPKSRRTTIDPEKLEILGWRAESDEEYQRVSKFLAETVIRSGEAVLARDVQDDSQLGFATATDWFMQPA